MPKKGKTLRRRVLQTPHVYVIAKILRERYKDFGHHNPSDPLDDLLFVICSRKTDEAKYLSTYASLRRRFPRLEDIMAAHEDEVAATLKEGGLSKVKARTVKQIIEKVYHDFQRVTLDSLITMSDADCEAYLVSLPGVGKKIARCVMMCRLGRNVFPVDTHCWRIALRLGWATPPRVGKHCSSRSMDRLQQAIPPELRSSLHVNLLSLGREFCTATKPKCGDCPICQYCPKRGV